MNKRNMYFDAVGLARAGKSLYAKDILKNNYPNTSEAQIIKAVEIGATLNEVLWEMADRYYSKEISEEEFKAKIRQICPDLDELMVAHLFAKALYDAK